MENNACTYYIQHHSEIDGRKAWHYLIDAPIGQINVVDFEQPDMTIKRKLFDHDYEKAENYYYKVCRDLANPNTKQHRAKIQI